MVNAVIFLLLKIDEAVRDYQSILVGVQTGLMLQVSFSIANLLNSKSDVEYEEAKAKIKLR